MVVDQSAPDWQDQIRKMTDGGADQVLACTAASRPELEGQPSGSRLIRMAPRFEDGTLTVVDDDLAATLEV
jgi:hypothetical protein